MSAFPLGRQVASRNRHTAAKFFIGAMTFAASLGLAGTAYAEPATTSVDLSLRAGPSTGYERLTVMPDGARVEVNRCTPDQAWCEVDYARYQGWASARYLEFGRAGLEGPVAEIEGDLPVEAFDFFASAASELLPGEIIIDDGQNGDDGNRDGRDRTQPDVAAGQICFYADFDYSGGNVCLDRGRSNADLTDTDWNDRISSVATGPGTAVLVCEHTGFDGRCRRIDGNIASFSGNWNDVISSYEVGGRRAGDGDNDGGNNDGGEDGNGDRAEAPTPYQACFYEDFGYAGQSRCINVGDRNAELDGNWNDAISSIRVGSNVELQVCEDWNFNGNCQRLTADRAELGGALNDNISSFRTRLAGTGNGSGNGNGEGDDGGNNDGVAANQACLYQDFDFNGASRCIDSGEQFAELGGDWNDAISSIRVGARAEVQICEDWNFNGDCQRVVESRARLSGDWNDAISSVRAR